MVLVLNYMFFQTYLNFPFKNKLKLKNHLLILSLFFIPFLLSQLMYYNFIKDGEEVNVLVAQPNIDPHKTKQYISQNYLSNLINDNLNESIDYVVFPESFLKNLNNSFVFVDYLKKYKKTDFIFGLPIIKDNKKYNAAAQISLNKATSIIISLN